MKIKLLFLFTLAWTSFVNAQNPIRDTSIIIKSKQGNIAGTLVLNQQVEKPKLVILVSSVVGNNRDISGHNGQFVNFPALANHLAKCGISTFRFDNRGVGESSGDNKSATLFTHADDVETIYRYFRKNKKFKGYTIGILGHSEGGASAEIVASRNKSVSFLLLLSTQGLGGWNFYNYQLSKYYENLGVSLNLAQMADSLYIQNASIQKSLFDTLAKYTDYNKIRLGLKLYTNIKSDSIGSFQKDEMDKLYNEWQKSQQIALRKFDPYLYLSKIKCLILALNGNKDDSVDAVPNLENIKKILQQSGNDHVETIVLANVNHYYHTLKEAPVWNLADKSETFSQIALNEICKWINEINVE
ncbi:pimeloyl-ACP methyl ester carboxylesterase [Pedobacter sp. UYEF25]